MCGAAVEMHSAACGNQDRGERHSQYGRDYESDEASVRCAAPIWARRGGRKAWVVDADIESAFDHLDHGFLLDTSGPIPGHELIKQWLKAGYVERIIVPATTERSPRGYLARVDET